MNNAIPSSSSGGLKPLPLDHYKNNLLKAKTQDLDSYMKYTNG